eukprot:818572-Lingulodinium_polyedra.AAC.1
MPTPAGLPTGGVGGRHRQAAQTPTPMPAPKRAALHRHQPQAQPIQERAVGPRPAHLVRIARLLQVHVDVGCQPTAPAGGL